MAFHNKQSVFIRFIRLIRVRPDISPGLVP